MRCDEVIAKFEHTGDLTSGDVAVLVNRISELEARVDAQTRVQELSAQVAVYLAEALKIHAQHLQPASRQFLKSVSARLKDLAGAMRG